MNRRRFLTCGLLAPSLGATLLAGARSLRAAETAPRKLALLIADYSKGNAEQHDQFALYRTLLARGFAAEEILCLSGALGRTGLFNFLHQASQRLQMWSAGQVFLHYSGNGEHRKLPNGDLRAGLKLSGNDIGVSDDKVVLWDEMFQALKLPASVRLTLLPDCCHTNLLLGQVPEQVTALVMAPISSDPLQCIAGNHTFTINGMKVDRGVISYYAGRALETAGTAADWLQKTQALCDADRAAGILPAARHLTFALAGSMNASLAGSPVK